MPLSDSQFRELTERMEPGGQLPDADHVLDLDAFEHGRLGTRKTESLKMMRRSTRIRTSMLKGGLDWTAGYVPPPKALCIGNELDVESSAANPYTFEESHPVLALAQIMP